MAQVPGNIRRAEHFLAFMRRFIAYLKKRMEVQQVESETPPTFLAHLQAQVAIDGDTLPPFPPSSDLLRLSGSRCEHAGLKVPVPRSLAFQTH